MTWSELLTPIGTFMTSFWGWLSSVSTLLFNDKVFIIIIFCLLLIFLFEIVPSLIQAMRRRSDDDEN
jgi:uncharacterized membrane protein